MTPAGTTTPQLETIKHMGMDGWGSFGRLGFTTHDTIHLASVAIAFSFPEILFPLYLLVLLAHSFL
jgi:hypothetical protein